MDPNVLRSEVSPFNPRTVSILEPEPRRPLVEFCYDRIANHGYCSPRLLSFSIVFEETREDSDGDRFPVADILAHANPRLFSGNS